MGKVPMDREWVTQLPLEKTADHGRPRDLWKGKCALALDLAYLAVANVSLDYLYTHHELLLNLRVSYQWKASLENCVPAWLAQQGSRSNCPSVASQSALPVRSQRSCCPSPAGRSRLKRDCDCKAMGGSLAGCGDFGVNRGFGGFSYSQFDIDEVGLWCAAGKINKRSHADPVGKLRKILGEEPIPNSEGKLLFLMVSSSSDIVHAQDQCHALQSQLQFMKW